MFKVDDEWRQGSYDDIGLPANMYEVQYFIDGKELFQIFINFHIVSHVCPLLVKFRVFRSARASWNTFVS